jgi:hypothetical protein
MYGGKRLARRARVVHVRGCSGGVVTAGAGQAAALVVFVGDFHGQKYVEYPIRRFKGAVTVACSCLVYSSSSCLPRASAAASAAASSCLPPSAPATLELAFPAPLTLLSPSPLLLSGLLQAACPRVSTLAAATAADPTRAQGRAPIFRTANQFLHIARICQEANCYPVSRAHIAMVWAKSPPSAGSLAREGFRASCVLFCAPSCPHAWLALLPLRTVPAACSAACSSDIWHVEQVRAPRWQLHVFEREGVGFRNNMALSVYDFGKVEENVILHDCLPGHPHLGKDEFPFAALLRA